MDPHDLCSLLASGKALILLSHDPHQLPLWAAWPPHELQGEGKDLGPARISRMGPGVLPTILISTLAASPPVYPEPPTHQCHALPGNVPDHGETTTALGQAWGYPARGSQASVCTGTPRAC